MSTNDRAVLDRFLTQHSNGLFNEASDFIAEQILPAVGVGPTTGKVPGYDSDHLRIVNTVHRGKGEYVRIDSGAKNSSNYEIVDHGLTHVITDNDRRNATTPFDAQKDASIMLTSLQALAKEKALADVLTGGSVITQGATLSGNAQYAKRSHADSKPIEDRLTAFNTVEDAAGVTPNVAIMNQKVARALRFHGQLMEALGYKDHRPNGLTNDELAKALEVDRVLIGKAMYNSAKEGQTAVLSPVWGNDLVYAHIAPNLELRQKTLGIEVRKDKTSPRAVYKWMNKEPIDSETICVTDNYDQLILNATCAYLLQDVI